MHLSFGYYNTTTSCPGIVPKCLPPSYLFLLYLLHAAFFIGALTCLFCQASLLMYLLIFLSIGMSCYCSWSMQSLKTCQTSKFFCTSELLLMGSHLPVSWLQLQLHLWLKYWKTSLWNRCLDVETDRTLSHSYFFWFRNICWFFFFPVL